MKNTNELKKFMQPLGGMAALKFMLESVGVKLNNQAVHSFNRQAIPAKYMPAIHVIKQKFNIDLISFVRVSERGQPSNTETIKNIYPLLLEKLKIQGLGLVASEMNIHKTELFKDNPPKRFNHYSLQKLLTKQLTPDHRQYFVVYWDAGKEIEADESTMDILG